MKRKLVQMRRERDCFGKITDKMEFEESERIPMDRLSVFYIFSELEREIDCHYRNIEENELLRRKQDISQEYIEGRRVKFLKESLEVLQEMATELIDYSDERNWKPRRLLGQYTIFDVEKTRYPSPYASDTAYRVCQKLRTHVTGFKSQFKDFDPEYAPYRP